MVALIIGVVVVILGLLGIITWFPDFVMILRGSVPAMFICGGLLAIIAGITSIKDSIEAKKIEEESKKEEAKPAEQK